MKKLVSIFVFAAAFLIGGFAPVNKPTIYEKLYPRFNQSEINELVGRRVVSEDINNIIGLTYPSGMKFTLKTGENTQAEVVLTGETGTIVELKKELAAKEPFWRDVIKDCGLLIKWDAKSYNGKDMYSCESRFTKRILLRFE